MKKIHINITIACLAACLLMPCLLQAKGKPRAKARADSGFLVGVLKTVFGTDDVRRYIRRGNKLMHIGQRDQAIGEYTRAFTQDSSNVLAAYNLATAYFPDEWKIMKPDTVRDSVMTHHFMMAGNPNNESNPVRRAKAFHNLGVMHQVRAGMSGDGKYQELQQAIEAYKEALRNNPTDDEARYNLVLCQRQLPPGDPNQNNGQNQNDNGQQDKQEQQEQQQEQQQQQSQDDQQQNPPQQQQQNQEWVDQMLNAAEQREKQTRRHLDENRQRTPAPRRNEKNW